MCLFREWVGKALAAGLLWGIKRMVRARRQRLQDRYNEIVVYTASDQSTVDSIVSVQHSLITVHEMLQVANITILKIWSILISKAHKVHILNTFSVIN